MPYPISQSTATEAYAQAAKQAAEARQMALLYDRLASTMDKTYITCKIADKAAQYCPAFTVRYYKYSSGDKALIFTPKADPSRRLTLDVARQDDRYLTAEALRERAEYQRGQADRYQQALDCFWDSLGQYNVLVNELNKVRNQIATVMYCSSRHWQF